MLKNHQISDSSPTIPPFLLKNHIFSPSPTPNVSVIFSLPLTGKSAVQRPGFFTYRTCVHQCSVHLQIIGTDQRHGDVLDLEKWGFHQWKMVINGG